VAPSVGGLMVVLAAQQAKAAPAGVVALATGAATPTAAGASIAKGVASTLFSAQVKAVVLALIVVAVVGVGAEVVRRAVATKPQTTATTIPATMPAPATQAVVAQNPAGIIAVGDLLEVAPSDVVAPEGHAQFFVRVDEQGQVVLPQLPPLKLAGLSTDVAAGRVSDAYRAAKVARSSVVSVAIRELGKRSPIKPGPIAVGDTVRLAVADLPPNKLMVVQETVKDDGTIQVPQAGRITVASLSEADAVKAVAREYERARIIHDATVNLVRLGPDPLPTDFPFVAPIPGPMPESDNTTPLVPGDLVAISVDELMGPKLRLTLLVHLSDEGNVSLFLIGQLKFAGLTPAEAAARVADAFEKAKIMAGAKARVVLQEPAAKSVKPGPIGAGDTLLVVVDELVGPMNVAQVNAVVAGDGTIEIPRIGKVSVAGKSEIGAGDAIWEQYRMTDKYDHPASVLRTGTSK
jgi:protein involved in polysaccharide export with SLBB domain